MELDRQTATQMSTQVAIDDVIKVTSILACVHTCEGHFRPTVTELSHTLNSILP